MENMFSDYNPSNDDELFDPDDLVGIALLNDDPAFKRATALKNLYNNIVDESVIENKINTVTKAIEDGIEVEETIPEPDLEDIEPDESDVSYDGMDAEDEIEAAQDIFNGEADDDVEIFDLVDTLED